MAMDDVTAARVSELYEGGLYLQAYLLLRPLEPFTDLHNPDHALLAARVAVQLGAPGVWQYLVRRTHREHPDHPSARLFHAFWRLNRRGPVETWHFMRTCLDLEGASDEDRAAWFAFHAHVLAILRDFETAEEWIARAEEASPDDPWVMVERAGIRLAADRNEDALAEVRRAMEVRPLYRPAVELCGQTLQLVGDDEGAVELLTEANDRLECASISGRLAGLLLMLQRYDEAHAAARRCQSLTPMAEPSTVKNIARLLSDTCYHVGDIAGAIDYGQQADTPFFRAVATSMERAEPDSRRVELPVAFVRQHHATCVPATLTAIARFWSMPAEHLDVAEEICYDGTPWHSERSWAERHGWVAREFTVDWDTAVALLDRGVPFTLTTVAPGYAHLQAVIGYDARRRTFLIRDPSVRSSEALADDLLVSMASTGPRGMVLVPADRAAVLDGINLPEAALWDRFFAVSTALASHHRDEAWSEFERLESASAGHRLALLARRAIAAYDSDTVTELQCTERLIECFPSDWGLHLPRLSLLQDLARRDDRLAILADLCRRRPVKDSAGDWAWAVPLFLQMYAEALRADAREYDRALRYVLRSLRTRLEGAAIYSAAGILWARQDYDTAERLYRFASCVDDKNEQASYAYFSSAWRLKRTDAALAALRSRVERFGAISSGPARTLASALIDMDARADALTVLEQAVALRPDDGDLLLYAAEQHGAVGQFDAADGLLERARDKAARQTWLRTAAGLSGAQGQCTDALRMWREVIDLEPLALDAHDEIAGLLAQIEGPAAAIAHFRNAAERFPHHLGLHRLWAVRLRHDDDPAAQEPVLRRIVDMNPADGWTRRELALCLGQQQRHDEALAEARLAVTLSPTDPSALTVLGQVCERAGRLDEARTAFRDALRISIDSDYAIGYLVGCYETPSEQRDALRFVADELGRQVVLGEGLLAFRRHAQRVLSAEDLHAVLRQGLAERPDLWQAWSALVRQLIEMNMLEPAAELARQETERFSLQSEAWMDLAAARAALGDADGERQALRRASEVAPGQSEPVYNLAQSYEQGGDYAEARRLLEQETRRRPGQGETHGRLSRVLWVLGEREQSIDQLRQALRIEPSHEWTWDVLRQALVRIGRPGELADEARQLTVRRPGDVSAWLILARMLEGPTALEERLQALDRAAALDPRWLQTRDLRAVLLADAGRWDEALQACRWNEGGPAPTVLRMREAAIEAQRGDLARAVEVLRAALDDDPQFEAGWGELTGWLITLGKPDEAEAAALKATSIFPRSAAHWRVLGWVRAARGSRAGSKEAYRRALEFEPDDGGSGVALFDMQLEDGELDDAEQTLGACGPHLTDEWRHCHAIRLAVARKDVSGAIGLLDRLCAAPHAEPGALVTAAGHLLEPPWNGPAAQSLARALDAPNANPETGACWIACHVCARRRPGSHRIAAAVLARDVPAVGVVPAAEVVANLVHGRILWRIVRENEGRLRPHGFTWSAIGYALWVFGLTREAVDWTSDWDQRSVVEPWALLNVAEALLRLGREQEAMRVFEAGWGGPHGDPAPQHAVWLAVGHALAGEHTEAADYLRHADGTKLGPYYEVLKEAASGIVSVQAAGPDDKPAAARAAIRGLLRARAAHRVRTSYHEHQLQVRVCRRSLRRIGADGGTFGARAYAWAASIVFH